MMLSKMRERVELLCIWILKMCYRSYLSESESTTPRAVESAVKEMEYAIRSHLEFPNDDWEDPWAWMKEEIGNTDWIVERYQGE